MPAIHKRSFAPLGKTPNVVINCPSVEKAGWIKTYVWYTVFWWQTLVVVSQEVGPAKMQFMFFDEVPEFPEFRNTPDYCLWVLRFDATCELFD